MLLQVVIQNAILTVVSIIVHLVQLSRPVVSVSAHSFLETIILFAILSVV